MEQSGICTATLYENNGLSYNFPDDANKLLIDSISTDGLQLDIEACQKISFKNTYSKGKNYEKIFNSKLQFTLFGFDSANRNLIKQLNTSIYGFSILINYLSGNSYMYIGQFKPIEVKTDRESNSFRLELRNNINIVQRIIRKI